MVNHEFTEWLNENIEKSNVLIDVFNDGSVEGHCLANTIRGRRGAFREILEKLENENLVVSQANVYSEELIL